MKSNNRLSALVLLSGFVAAGNALAASVTGDTIYEKVDMFNNYIHFTDGFTINTRGVYEATLTDFKFPNAFKSSGMNITTSTDSLGKLLGPGTFTFEAGPGNYNISMFAEVGNSQAYAEEKRRLIDEEQQRRREIKTARWNGMTAEEQLAKQALRKDLLNNLSKAEREERRARREKALDRWDIWAEEQLADINIGQYGIEISMLNGTVLSESTGSSVVPLPAAAWLFGSGILALAGLGRRKVTR